MQNLSRMHLDDASTELYGSRDRDLSAEELLNDLPAGSEIIDLGYTPRPFQAELHSRLKRFNVLVCHRRFGKTVFAIMEMIDKGLRCDLRNPQYAYIAPTYSQAKRVAWKYVLDFTRKIPGAKVNKQELSVYIPRPDKDDVITFMLLGADNPDSQRGIYLDGCILDEYAQCNPIIWGEIVRPALSDRKGWGIFIGTPKGENHFHKIYRDHQRLMLEKPDRYFAASHKASETAVIDDEELADAQATMTEEEYRQEYECDFTANLIGSYYGKYLTDLEKAGRRIPFNYDPNGGPVTTYWDLGISDTTAVWFVQYVGREIRVLDYMEKAGKGLEWWAQQILSKPYVYESYGHYIPHDGAARELGTGKTRQELLETFGLNTQIVPRQTVADGINATRMVLTKNIWFNKTEMVDMGWNALKNYQRVFDGKKNMFIEKPLHNWASNGSDAFRYFAMVQRGPTELQDFSELRKMKTIIDYDELEY